MAVGRTNARAASSAAPFSLVVTVESGAAVTATNGSKTVTGTSSGGTCTLTLPEAGTWTVSATKDGQISGTKTVSVVDTYAETLRFVSSALNDNDWSVIRAISDEGTGENYWSVGDRKAVKLNGTVGKQSMSNISTYVFIIGFDHNFEYEGRNRIHFQFAKTAVSGGTDVCFTNGVYNTAVSDTGYFSMNSTNTNVGGWNASQMRHTICGQSFSDYSGTFIDALPAELRSVLKTVTKYTDNSGNKSTAAEGVTATTDVIFLLAEYEVFGTIVKANPNESAKQAQYEYYSAGNPSVKYRNSSTTTAAIWWLRSPDSNNNTRFVYVSTSGTVASAGAYYSYGFAPGFCV